MAELAAFVVRSDTELLLKSRRVVPGRLLGAGLAFGFPDWPEAARDLVRRARTSAVAWGKPVASAAMVLVLLVFGALATPVTGLFVRPDVNGARHGDEMYIAIGTLSWYGYLAVSGALLAAGLIGSARGTPRSREVTAGAATALVGLIVVFGSIHVLAVTTGVFRGDGQPMLAALSAAISLTATVALGWARTRIRSTG
nr:DUF1731 domain-containing protein [Kibdelosporangium phytohabitans]